MNGYTYFIDEVAHLAVRELFSSSYRDDRYSPGTRFALANYSNREEKEPVDERQIFLCSEVTFVIAHRGRVVLFLSNRSRHHLQRENGSMRRRANDFCLCRHF